MASVENVLHSRLLSVVDDLFDSHNTSPTSLDTYNTELADLQKDLIDSQSAGTLQSQTADLAYSVARTIEVVCQTLMNLHVQTNNILRESEKELNAFECTEVAAPPPARTIKKRTHSSTSPEPPTSRKRTKRTASAESAPSSSSSSSRSSSPTSKRDYTPLYTWLSNNLHNPYPPASVRSDLCRESGGADVERWFTTARRRIGWTELVKRVPGGRERVVSAAKHYWKGEGEGEEYPGIDVEFALIEKNLKDVYGPRLGGPGEVVKLFGVVPSLKRKRDEEEPKQSSKRQKEERPPKAFRPYEPPNLDNWFGDVYPFPEGNIQLEVELPASLEAPPITSDLDSFQAAFDTPLTDCFTNIDFNLADFDFGADPSWSTDPLFTSAAFDFGSDFGIAVA
ncbi:hypothetical protein ARMSODRAFT_1011994 [Armillaria solidipes]|uniref:KN homeodomain domain-containing protein n=1 Tax=Armillaria solidipes TaxID=1076256 RepID=A0A2H3CEG3_9AGAR|nr:hypothetical protein ARMSODRAFT_1011994 [Armillaria solidipes]